MYLYIDSRKKAAGEAGERGEGGRVWRYGKKTTGTGTI